MIYSQTLKNRGLQAVKTLNWCESNHVCFRGNSKNVFLLILQFLLGIYFALVGVMHFIVPPGLPAPMAWMYDLSPTLHYISGTAEILGGLGLILPSMTRIKPVLTPLAGLGLALVMVFTIFYHLQRGETMNIGFNVVLALLSAFMAYGRWKIAPLADRSAS